MLCYANKAQNIHTLTFIKTVKLKIQHFFYFKIITYSTEFENSSPNTKIRNNSAVSG